MATELKIPQSGESITEVQIGQWRKSEGDAVQADEVLVEIETDKAAMDLPAPVSGVLSKILKGSGQDAAVGEVIAYIEEGASGDGAGSAKAKQEAKAPAKGITKPPAKEPPAQQPPQKDPSRGEPPRKEPPAEKTPVKEPPRPPDEPDEKRAERHAASAQVARVMPSARRELADRGLEADEVKASGPGGRLLKEDVVGHTRQEPASPAQPAPAPQAPGADGREEEIVAMSPMRRVIARNLVQAQQTAALLTTFNEADMSAVMALRKQHQEAFQKKYGIKLGFMSFFVKASIEALKLFPAVNAEVRENNIVFKNYYDIGIAVGGGKGLVVPVIRGADLMSFAEIEQTIADLAARAQKNQLELAELKGGTFTISNGGIYGSMLSTPIVNPPQSGILGLHSIQDRPMARDGQVVIRPMMYLALTYDHRIVDGREAVSFLRQIKDIIEDPIRILIEV
jgi:2-oxoglutarate dehydrogenase E2 component (dihydrolipoamide succinyltransferase)